MWKITQWDVGSTKIQESKPEEMSGCHNQYVLCQTEDDGQLTAQCHRMTGSSRKDWNKSTQKLLREHENNKNITYSLKVKVHITRTEDRRQPT